MNSKSFNKKALSLSVALLVLWALLGTGATIAWFTDTTPVAKNSFAIGELNLDVSYKNDEVPDYTPVDPETPIFNDKALYEPGYTQVVYLKIENNGEIDFDYKVSVDMRSYADSINVYGTTLHLPAYLRFGVLFGASEAELNRELARVEATEWMDNYRLNQYSEVDITVPVGGTRYAALVVYMPEEIGNEANYRLGENPPEVELGITVFAQQAGAPMD